MSQSKRFKINEPEVIQEIIEGEAVLVNLETGAYYNTDKVGASILHHIGRGETVNQIINNIADEYDGNQEEIKNGINQMIERLQQEDLIVPNDGEPSEHGSSSSTNIHSHGGTLVFEEPVLHKYTDMQDLLLLDPIHEVDETGWPTEKKDKPNEKNLASN
jgi:hypothetical protein